MCFIDLGKLSQLKISLAWSKSVKQTVCTYHYPFSIKDSLSERKKHVDAALFNPISCDGQPTRPTRLNGSAKTKIISEFGKKILSG